MMIVTNAIIAAITQVTKTVVSVTSSKFLRKITITAQISEVNPKLLFGSLVYAKKLVRSIAPKVRRMKIPR